MRVPDRFEYHDREYLWRRIASSPPMASPILALFFLKQMFSGFPLLASYRYSRRQQVGNYFFYYLALEANVECQYLAACDNVFILG